jgi:hypothetical protein
LARSHDGQFPGAIEEGNVLEAVDATLEAFLRGTVPLSASEIDVAFEPPTREWSAKLTRPTVNAHLWDVRRSRDRARTGVEQVQRNEQRFQRMALPRVELRYLLTVWASEHRDERTLLGGILRAALAVSHVPPTFVAPALADLSPVVLQIAGAGDIQVDASKALDGQVKSSLELVVVSDVDTGLGELVAPPVTEFEVSVSDATRPTRRAELRRVAGEVRVEGAPGRRVSSPRGVAVVNDAGRFLIAAATGDEILVELDPPRTAIVPERGGVVVT